MENKNKYENVIIITGGFTQEEYKKSLKNITEKIKNIIDIEIIEEIGKKKLAYEVKKNTELGNLGEDIVVDFEKRLLVI